MKGWYVLLGVLSLFFYFFTSIFFVYCIIERNNLAVAYCEQGQDIIRTLNEEHQMFCNVTGIDPSECAQITPYQHCPRKTKFWWWYP